MCRKTDLVALVTLIALVTLVDLLALVALGTGAGVMWSKKSLQIQTRTLSSAQ